MSPYVCGRPLNGEMIAETSAQICFMSAFTVFKRTKERSIGTIILRIENVQTVKLYLKAVYSMSLLALKITNTSQK